MRATRQGANFIVVLIGLVLIFKENLSSLVGDIFDTINSKSESV